jgi:beta-lactam-binding protein with PASTA domain
VGAAGGAGMGTGPNPSMAGGYVSTPMPTGEHRKGGSGGILLAALAAIAVLALAIFVFSRNNNGATPTPTDSGTTSSQAQLPSVVGQTENQARAILKDWKKVDRNLEESTQYAKGVVIKQTPSAGTMGDKNSLLITLTVSAGLPQDNLKDLTDQTRDQAVSYLASKNLRAKVTSEASAKKKDTVLRTSPEAGTSIQAGQEVTVYVSSGKNTLPNVKNQSLSAAMQALQLAGFTSVRQTQQTTTDVTQNDQVMEMSPSPDQLLDLTTGITLTVLKYQNSDPTTSPTTPTSPPTTTPTTTPTSPTTGPTLPTGPPSD